MTLKRLEAGAAASIPDPDGVIARRRREPLRVGREGYRDNWTAMALKHLETGAAAGIPDPDGVVVRRRHEPL